MRFQSHEEYKQQTLEIQLEDNIFLKAIEFGLSHPDGFSYSEIVEGLELDDEVWEWEKDIIEKYLHSAYVNARETKTMGRSGNSETPFLLVGNPKGYAFNHDENRYTLTFDAHFKFIDYQELKLARKNAKEAKRLSLWAIGISVLAIIVSALLTLGVNLFYTQTIKVDESQLQLINSLMGQ